MLFHAISIYFNRFPCATILERVDFSIMHFVESCWCNTGHFVDKCHQNGLQKWRQCPHVVEFFHERCNFSTKWPPGTSLPWFGGSFCRVYNMRDSTPPPVFQGGYKRWIVNWEAHSIFRDEKCNRQASACYEDMSCLLGKEMFIDWKQCIRWILQHIWKRAVEVLQQYHQSNDYYTPNEKGRWGNPRLVIPRKRHCNTFFEIANPARIILAWCHTLRAFEHSSMHATCYGHLSQWVDVLSELWVANAATLALPSN